MKPYKRRTVPYKIMYYLLYGEQNWLSRPGNRVVEVETGPMTRALRISNSRFYEAIEYLCATGVLLGVNKVKKGSCRIKYRKPLS